jgi:hypothetical protein
MSRILFLIGTLVVLLGSLPFYAIVVSNAFGLLGEQDPVGLMLLHFATLVVGVPAIAIGIGATLVEPRRR